MVFRSGYDAASVTPDSGLQGDALLKALKVDRIMMAGGADAVARLSLKGESSAVAEGSEPKRRRAGESGWARGVARWKSRCRCAEGWRRGGQCQPLWVCGGHSRCE
jgi:hypothetical protein